MGFWYYDIAEEYGFGVQVSLFLHIKIRLAVFQNKWYIKANKTRIALARFGGGGIRIQRKGYLGSENCVYP